MTRFDIVALPGDGIGPEVVSAARSLLDAIATRFDVEFAVEELPVGGNSIDAHGVPLLPEVLERCRAADAVLLGAVGGPKWDSTDPDAPRPEQGLLGLRKGLELFANLRPVRVSPALTHASPLREELVRDADLLIVRELTGGIYFGDRGRRDGVAHDTCVYSTDEIERIAELAFQLASGPARRGRVTSVDKANILETSRLWRETVERVGGRHEGVALEHMLVDNAAMQLVSRPADFDVILTENMFGDILSDEAAMIAGSIGLLASASLGNRKPGRAGGPGPGLGLGLGLGVYEPVHGSAPDIAGKGVANPLATFGSVALMLRHSLGMEDAATAVESAVDRVLERGFRTPDLATDRPEEQTVGTGEMTRAVTEGLGAVEAPAERDRA
jgi:3-isopropylmalate dehydrogenase